MSKRTTGGKKVDYRSKKWKGGFGGEQPGTLRERAHKLVARLVRAKQSRGTVIGQVVRRVGIARTTAANWYGRWAPEHRPQ